MKRVTFYGTIALLVVASASHAHADIYQWEYINPADPSQGKQQSTTLAPDGAGVDAVPAADLSGRDLTMAYLIASDLMGTFGNNASFFNADLSQANLTNANFAHSILTDANFTGAEVRGAYFYTDTYHRGTGITLAQLYSTASYQAHNLSGIKLSGNNLATGNFSGQNLTNSEFYGTTLADANLHFANLTNATLYGANLTEANFTEANLTGASFYQANAPGADFTETNLTDADFGWANLRGASFRDAILANAKFVYYRPPYSCNSFICVASATFTDADLTGADARGASLAINNTSPFLNLSLSDKITTNLILPDGHIEGLDLNAGSRLVVRDYDGDPTRTNPYFGTPEPVSPIPITVDQHFAMGPGGTLRMVFEADAWDSTISFAPGIPVTLGGTLELTFAHDVNPVTQLGRTFDLFDWTGVTPTGTFNIASPYRWDTSNLYTTGHVTLLSIPEPATFALVALVVPLAVGIRRRVRDSRKVRASLFGAMLVALASANSPSRAAAAPITVMTQNLYQGFDAEKFLADVSANPGNVVALTTAAYAQVLANDFAARADAVALAVDQHRPALIGLQEVSLYRSAPFDGPGPPHATNVEIDYLDTLLDALSARGLSYAVVASVQNTDAEFPRLVGFDANNNPILEDIRLTDRDVILARTDLTPSQLEVSNPQSGNYSADFSALGITFRNGWTAVDVEAEGTALRFVNTHLARSPATIQELQAAELVAGPANTSLPTILVGDFNSRADGTGSASYANLIAAGFSDAWSAIHPDDAGYTCCQAANLLNAPSQLSERIDLALFRNGPVAMDALVVGAAQSDRTPTGLWPSDHAGIVATLNIVPEPGTLLLVCFGVVALVPRCRSKRVLQIAAALFPLVTFATAARADIFQWEYIDPADPSQGKRQSMTLAPGGAGVDAVPGTNLYRRNLNMAYLIGADLTGASGWFSNLIHADLSQTNLTNADFSGAFLSDADFTGARVQGSRFDKVSSYLYFPGCRWSGCPLIGGITLTQLYSTASYQANDLSGIGLRNNNLAGGNFAGQNLTNADFGGATLTDANLTDAEVRGAYFDITGITLAQLYSTASYRANDLNGIGLGGNNLAGGKFAKQNLANADFSYATLTDVDFKEANLTNAVFRFATLGVADFTGAQVSGAIFDGITLAQLYSTDSYQAQDLSGVSFGHEQHRTYLVGGNFAEQNLTNADFGWALLSGANFTAADARGANLRHLDIITTNLIKPDGHLDGVNLIGGSRIVLRDYDGDGSRWWRINAIAPPPVTIDEHLSMGRGGTLRMVFEADAWDSTIFFAPGIPVTLGGTLELTFANDVNLASQLGRTFDLFDWTGVSPIGTFDVDSRYDWDLSNLYTTGEVTLLTIPEPGTLLLTVLAGVSLMCRRRRLVCQAALCAFLAFYAAECAWADTFGTGANTFDLEFVTISNPGNAADTTGNPNPAGLVPYRYRIGKYEISEDMIDKANALGGLGITKDFRDPDYPATSVSWLEAAIFVNWLNTSTGGIPAYKFDNGPNFLLWEPGDPGYNPSNPFRNSLAKYVLPSADEWYKAAYYDAAAGVYFDYPTGSDTAPTAVGSGTTAGTAVYFQLNSLTPAVTTAAGGLSPYGTMGQGGNVMEWEETEHDLANNSSSADRGFRGGSWRFLSGALLASSRQRANPAIENIGIGFRVASVPEPSTLLLGAMAGVGLVWRRRSWRGTAILALAIVACPAAVRAVTIETVPVGNPGNAADTTGFGSVAYSYRISKHEVTNAQYTEFLNAVDPTGSNLLSLYNSSMSTDARGGISFNGGAADGSKYEIKSSRDNNPVVFVSFFDAMRFVNWLHNGQGSGDTESGVYTIGTSTNEVRSAGAKYWIPSEDEWYKAAYYDPSGVYYDYQTGTDTEPYSDNPGSLNTPDDTNVANFYKYDFLSNGYDDGNAVTGSTSFDNSQNYLTDVGAYSHATTPYGTFDQGGNVREWNEAVSRFFRNSRGGSWGNDSSVLVVESRQFSHPTSENLDRGFRVAGVIPEPSTLLLGTMAGIGLICRRRLVYSAALYAFLSCFAAERALADTFGSGTNTFEIEFVTIGNPNNPDDTTGNPNPAGKVEYVYRIGKYEISEDMIDKASTLGGLGITKATRGPDKPATAISWSDAARFVNWLNTSTGGTPAYKFDNGPNFLLWEPGDPGYNPNNKFRNRNAKYFLPSADEWYKAAYYDPAGGVYYDYPTGSDTAPTAVASGIAGDTAVYDHLVGQGPADITLAGGLSPYGTMGQGGNALEWEESEFDLVNDSTASPLTRGVRGGGWLNSSDLMLSSSRFSGGAPGFLFYGIIGFRVASLPEPSTLLLFSLGFGLLSPRRRAKLRKRGHIFQVAAIFSLIAFATTTHADIYQWEYINPADPSQGKQQSTTLAPDGAGVDAVPGADLSRRYLNMAYLTGADLTGANGLASNLTNADLSHANLTNADFTYATFSDADFTAAEVHGANLLGTTGSGFTFAQLASTAGYQARDLSGIGLGFNDLRGWNFAGQNLANANFRGAKLTSANFTGAVVRGSSFDREVGCPSDRPCVIIEGTGIALAQLYSTASYQNGDLSGINFSYNELNNVNFTDQNLSNAAFYAATLENANFFQANLSNTSFFAAATLTGASFREANLTNANFSGVTLTDIDFAGAEVRGATLLGMTLDQLYSTASYQARDLTGTNLPVNLIGGNLTGQNLTNASFFAANLTDADFAGAEIRGANFGKGRPPRGPFLIGTGIAISQLYSTASYQAHDLTGIGLILNDLTGVNFASQNLASASFHGATLANAILREANLANANFTNDYHCTGFICRETLTKLTGADLSRSDARGAVALDDYLVRYHDATTTNMIWPDGHVNGLDLEAGERLVVRDHDFIPITIDQHLTMGPGGTLRMVFEADAWDSTISFAPGIPVTLGGTLELTFANDVNLASQLGRTFDLFDWTRVSPTGVFTVSSQYHWDTSNLYTTGEVSLSAIPEPSTVILIALSLVICLAHRWTRNAQSI